MEPKLLSRDDFREGVFKRDGYHCVFCANRHGMGFYEVTCDESPQLDAHHLIERRLWSDGGYYLDNGVTVCQDHHMLCETTELSVEEAREVAGITRIVVPDQFYPEQPITKWGDYILEDGRRTKGELFYDESVQKVLAKGGKLDLYSPYVKYGRTFHLPFSPGIHDDDKALKDCSQFEGEEVIISVKMDGENTSGYSDGHVHARSIDSRGGEDRAWVKQFLINNVCFNLPEGWRICGENLWAQHSITYYDLESYFLGFSLWNEKNVCLSWDETLEYFELLGVTPVQVLYRGIFSEEALKYATKFCDELWERREGYVVRLAREFKYSEFKTSVAKYVRAGHVQTVSHWRHKKIVPNELAPGRLPG